MPKISALPPMTSADGDDEAPIVDDSVTTTKKFTLTLLKEWLQSLVGWITTAMITDGAVTAAKTGFGGNYSTSEVNTGFTWIDGKPIYKKTVSFGALPNNTTKNVAHSISGATAFVALAGVSTNGTLWLDLSHGAPVLTNNLELYVSTTNITVASGSNFSSFSTTYITLFYIK
jgi:hypothetical protein